MADSGNVELKPPTVFEEPRLLRWELVADWTAVDLGMRPTEVSLSVETDANVRTIVQEGTGGGLGSTDADGDNPQGIIAWYSAAPDQLVPHIGMRLLLGPMGPNDYWQVAQIEGPADPSAEANPYWRCTIKAESHNATLLHHTPYTSINGAGELGIPMEVPELGGYIVDKLAPGSFVECFITYKPGNQALCILDFQEVPDPNVAYADRFQPYIGQAVLLGDERNEYRIQTIGRYEDQYGTQWYFTVASSNVPQFGEPEDKYVRPSDDACLCEFPDYPNSTLPGASQPFLPLRYGVDPCINLQWSGLFGRVAVPGGGTQLIERGPVWPGMTARALCGQIDTGVLDQTWESVNAGAWRISYGRAAVGRTILVDLATQRLYLGNCDYVRVEALRWKRLPESGYNAAPFAAQRDPATYTCKAHIGIAQGGNYDEALCTVIALVGDPDQGAIYNVSRWLYPPPSAAFMEPIVTEYVTDSVRASTEVEDSVFESDDPDFRFVQDQGQSMLYNPREGLVQPRHRVPVTSGRVCVLSTQPVPRRIWVGARFVLTL